MGINGSYCQLKDLEPVTKKRYLIYCYALYIEKNAKGPLKLYVTDFTTNSRIANPAYPKDLEISEDYYVNDTEILRVDVFDESLVMIENLYNSHFSSDLLDDMEDSNMTRYLVFDRFWLLRLTVDLKIYNSSIEARLRGADPFKDDHFHAQQLMLQLAKVPEAVKARGRQFGPLPFETGSRHSESVKVELRDDEFIPDTLFERDYVSDEGFELGGSDKALKESDAPRGISRREFSQLEISQTTMYSFKELNSMTVRLEVLYSTQGYLVATKPALWSMVCAKDYRYDPISRQYEPGDPIISPVELIFCENKPSRPVVQTPVNSISIFLNSSQVMQLFDISSVELFYTKSNLFDEKIHGLKDVLMDLMLFRTKLSIGKEYITVWAAKNLSLPVL